MGVDWSHLHMVLNGLLLFCLVGPINAWGPDGHTIVAHIAETMLNPEANASLWEILGNTDLNNASDWNDDFDHSDEGIWSFPLHFINYQEHSCDFFWERDCQKDLCNAGAIINYTHQLANTNLDKNSRAVALKFI